MGKTTKGRNLPSQVKETSEKMYSVRDILAETDQSYLIDWEDDQVTGERFKPTWEPKANPNGDALDDWEYLVGEQAANQRADEEKPMDEESVSEENVLIPTAPVFYNGKHGSLNPARNLTNIIRQAQGYFLRDGQDAWSHTSRAMRRRVLDQVRACVDISVTASYPDLQDEFAQIRIIHRRLELLSTRRRRSTWPFPGYIFHNPGAAASVTANIGSSTLDSLLANPLSGVFAKDFVRDSPNTSLYGKNILWILSIGGMTVVEVMQELHAAGKARFDMAYIQWEVENELRKMHGDFAANLAEFNDFRGIFRSSLGNDFAIRIDNKKISTSAEGEDKRKRAEPDDDMDLIQQEAEAGGRATRLRIRKKRKGNNHAIATSQEPGNRESHAGNPT